MNSKALPETDDRFRPLLIGSGRLARHLDHYFTKASIPHLAWNEPRKPVPPALAKASTHLWVLVSDQALPAVCGALRAEHPGIPVLHSSAACAIPDAITVHPLMTFGPDLYPLASYQETPLTLFKEELAGAPEILRSLQAVLPNPVSVISGADRARYHATCVMLSNFSLLLWEAAFRAGGISDLIPVARAEPILNQTLKNFVAHGISSLTGPLVRGDHDTIDTHLRAMGSTPESRLYRAFLDYFLEFRAKMPNSPEERTRS